MNTVFEKGYSSSATKLYSTVLGTISVTLGSKPMSNENLSGAQLAAALAEEVYRRSLKEFQVTEPSLGVSAALETDLGPRIATRGGELEFSDRGGSGADTYVVGAHFGASTIDDVEGEFAGAEDVL